MRSLVKNEEFNMKHRDYFYPNKWVPTLFDRYQVISFVFGIIDDATHHFPETKS